MRNNVMKTIKNILNKLRNNGVKTIKNILNTLRNNTVKTIKNVYLNKLYVIYVGVKSIEVVYQDIRKLRNVNHM